MEDSMATLNVKNLPAELYRKLQERARGQHRSTAQEVTKLLTDALEKPPLLSILELRGLGKAEWAASDSARHVERERRSWD